MGNALQLLVGLDQEAARATAALRWSPVTTLLVLASAWWVKGPLLVGVGWCADLRQRRLLPLVAGTATLSFALASWLNALLKAAVDRSRPPHAIGLDAIGGVPVSPSFPSGHAMSAFAVAAAIAVLSPRLRVPVLAVAALIAFSRVYLGVHFWLDVLVGAGLGMAIGGCIALAMRRLARALAG
jgi:undecaprenyl-diphosphatase